MGRLIDLERRESLRKSGLGPIVWACLLGFAVMAPAVHAGEVDLEGIDSAVEVHYQAGRYAEAEALAREGLEARRRTLGDHHLGVATSLFLLGRSLKGLRDYEAARPFYEEYVAIEREVHGRHPEVASSLNDLGLLLTALGDYPAARVALEEGLEMRRETLGPRHRDVAISLDSLAAVFYDLADYSAERALREESLSILREVLGSRHPDVASSLNSLAGLLQHEGDHPEALILFEESLSIRREALGPADPKVAKSLNNYAVLLSSMGDWSAALALHEEALAIQREALGNRHSDVALSLKNIGKILQDQGDLSAARQMYEEGLAIERDALGPTRGVVMNTMSALAGLLKLQGDNAAARVLLEEVLAVRRKTLGDRHPDVAASLNNLGGLLKAQGDTVVAMKLYEESLDIWRETLGPRHQHVATSMNNLATLLHARGDEEGAIQMYRESLDITREALGPRHPTAARAMNNLALLLAERGDYAAADAMYDESLQITREVHGPRHILVAATLNNLAHLRELQGEHSAARAMYEECLDIEREALGPRHPRLAATLSNLAVLFEGQGQMDAARRARLDALDIAEERLTLLDVLSEREALRYVQTLRPKFDGWLGVFDEPGDARDAWAHTLRFKGVVAARQRAVRAYATAEPEAADLAAQHRTVRDQLARVAMANVLPETDLEARRAQLAALSTSAEGIERQLLSASAVFSRARATEQATPEALCAALPRGTAVVDILGAQIDHEWRYVAFVADRRCEIRRVDLGAAAPIDDAIAAWVRLLSRPLSSPHSLAERGSELAELVWVPLAESLGRARHVLVIPDGTLASVPFGALPLPDGRYLLEETGISYLDRANDLLAHSPKGDGAVVVGGVDFGAAADAEAQGPPEAMAPCAHRDWKALPGTASEAEAVAARLDAVVLTGSDATEAAVRAALPGKRVAHIATHGFFARSQGCVSVLDGSGGVGYDPMLLSGIVLSGANLPADPLAAQDGVLTAAEVASLDLSETELVVLSACKTGLGQGRAGQGVLGLRRGFTAAGAGSLVMTLWTVGDEETATLMDRFYDNLRRRPPAEALLKAQRSLVDEVPWAWAGVVATGAPR